MIFEAHVTYQNSEISHHSHNNYIQEFVTDRTIFIHSDLKLWCVRDATLPVSQAVPVR